MITSPAGEALDQVRSLLDAAEAKSAAGRSLPPRSWTPENQRRFLEQIADGDTVEDATFAVGLSPQSAYAFRRTARGRAFALGWRAAALIARDTLADKLLERAMQGQNETVTRDDGSEVTRFRYDNRLATTLLRRLDRQVEEASDADTAAARMVAGEFDAFLDIVEKDGGPARAGLFLARRGEGVEEGRDLQPILALAAADRFLRTGAATGAEVDAADLDPARRDGWTADQWRRAEAIGLGGVVAHPVEEAETDLAAEQAPPETAHGPQPSQFVGAEDGFGDPDRVWQDPDKGWLTDYPPPADYDGLEHGSYGEDDYHRTLTPDEEEVWEAPLLAEVAALRERERAEFAALLTARAAPVEESVALPCAAAPA
jgi:hypothetical protein